MNHTGQKIAVLGLGRSGEAAARLLARHGAEVTIFDSAGSEAVQRRAEKITGGIRVVTGPAALRLEEQFDLAVLSPGIDPETAFVRQFIAAGIPLTGELELASTFCQTPLVAVTGTNGKTTTTELIEVMLKGAGLSTVACGNIGLPFSEVVAQTDLHLDVVTLEVSSFQLETVATFRPSVALWLNFSPDHLDRYPGLEEYRAAKLRIFANQTPEDFAVVNAREVLPPLQARTITFSATLPEADFSLRAGVIHHLGRPVAPVSSFRLGGLHNVENLMAALAVAVALDIPFSEALPPLQHYTPAPHRCEHVVTWNDVDFINDSKATNLDALARALESQDAPVILIAGGKDKGFSFAELGPVLPGRVRTAVLIGEMAGRIEEEWGGYVPCRKSATLEEAVEVAAAAAGPGDVVLFSPGTSSFDMFRDYAERGARFRQAALALVQKHQPLIPS